MAHTEGKDSQVLPSLRPVGGAENQSQQGAISGQRAKRHRFPESPRRPEPRPGELPPSRPQPAPGEDYQTQLRAPSSTWNRRCHTSPIHRGWQSGPGPATDWAPGFEAHSSRQGHRSSRILDDEQTREDLRIDDHRTVGARQTDTVGVIIDLNALTR